MISIHDNDEIKSKAIEAGVAIYENKTTPVEELLNKIHILIR